MTCYEKWKSDGAYSVGLAMVERLAPEHPLLPMLRGGDTDTNIMYLKGVLMGIEWKEAPPEPLVPELKAEKNTEVWFYTRQRQLMSGRAKLRNKYHQYGLRNDVPAVQARIEINRDLVAIRAELHDISRRIEHYEKTGELIAIPEADAVSDSFQGGTVQDFLNARSNVSRYKKKIQKLYKDKASKEVLQKAELKLKEWETKRDLLDPKKATT